MKVVHMKRVKKQRVDMPGAKDVLRQMPLSSHDGAPTFSFRVFTVQPGGHTPYHTHPFEHLNYVIEGRGALVNARGTRKPIRRGDFALVLPGEKHQYRNTSRSEPLVLICAVPREHE